MKLNTFVFIHAFYLFTAVIDICETTAFMKYELWHDILQKWFLISQ